MYNILHNKKYEIYDIYYEYPGEDRNRDIKGKLYIMPFSSKKGFNFGYSLFIPDGCQKDTTLLVHCCNTGGATIKNGKLDLSDIAVHLHEGIKAAKLSTIENNLGMMYGNDLKMPVLTPLIPRIRGYYTQALGSSVYKNDVSYLIEDNNTRSGDKLITSEEIEQIKKQCKDLPTQLINITLESRLVLEQLGIKIDDKIIIEGYSAGAKFANHFTALHPEMVKACIGGGNSGLGILPLKELGGEKLEFPLGVADIPNFNEELFKVIPQYYYIGNEDYNDPAMTDDERLDKKGVLPTKYKDNYTKQEVNTIHSILGTNPQERFDNNEKLYGLLGINAKFQKIGGDHNTVINQKNKKGDYLVNEHIKEFIVEVLENEKQNNKTKGYIKIWLLGLITFISIAIVVFVYTLIK